MLGKFTTTLLLLLFAIGFPIIGSYATLPMYKQFSGWFEAQAYVAVPGKVMSSSLDRSTSSEGGVTYRAMAQFYYDYQGQQYLSTRVNLLGAGRDNVGSYQQDMYEQLNHARSNSAPVTLLVNPLHPEQAVYDRTIRWSLTLVMLLFALVFILVGIFAWWMIWRIWRNKEVLDPSSFTSSVNSPSAVSSSFDIHSDKSGLIRIFIFSIFWNLISWPITLAFLSSRNENPWWVSIAISIFPIVGLLLISSVIKDFRKQWRIGKPVLVLLEAGVPGSTPLQGKIRFNPAFAMRLDTTEMTHTVSVKVEFIRDDKRGDDTKSTTLWQGQALQTHISRGTESLNFKIELPASLPVSTASGNGLVQDYWKIVLESLGSTVNFRLPENVFNIPIQQSLQSEPAVELNADALKIATRVRMLGKVAGFIFIAYFFWVVINDFAIPFYQHSQNKTPEMQQSSLAESSKLPKIIVPFVLDSLAGNGFGVVTKVSGNMEIGDNTIKLFPESIELRTYGVCEINCPFIHTVQFSLTQDKSDHFSTIGESTPIPVLKKFAGARSIELIIDKDKTPIIIHFSNRDQLSNLRLTLAIEGESYSEGKTILGSWYTHAEPFAAALGKQDMTLDVADNNEQRQKQALQAISQGRAADLQQLLQAGVDANTRDKDDETLLMRATNRNDLSMVKILLSHGAQVNAATPTDKQGNGARTALHAAVLQDAVDVVDALLKAGANPQAQANQVWTPMHYAAYLGAVKSIRHLHEHHVNIDEPFKGSRGTTPLMLAAQYEQTSTIRLLLELGADIRKKDIYGENACSYARFYQKPTSITALGCN